MQGVMLLSTENNHIRNDKRFSFYKSKTPQKTAQKKQKNYIGGGKAIHEIFI